MYDLMLKSNFLDNDNIRSITKLPDGHLFLCVLVQIFFFCSTQDGYLVYPKEFYRDLTGQPFIVIDKALQIGIEHNIVSVDKDGVYRIHWGNNIMQVIDDEENECEENQLHPDFDDIEKIILSDKRLTPKARFLMLYCLAYKDTKFKFGTIPLSLATGMGVSSTTSGIKELELLGYITREYSKKENGSFREVRYIFHIPERVEEQ